MTPEQKEHRRNIAELTDKVLDDKYGNPGPFKTEIEKLKGKKEIMNAPTQQYIDKATALYELRFHPTTTTNSPRQEQVWAIAQSLTEAREEGRRDMQRQIYQYLSDEVVRMVRNPKYSDAEVNLCSGLISEIRNLPTNAPEGESK